MPFFARCAALHSFLQAEPDHNDTAVNGTQLLRYSSEPLPICLSNTGGTCAMYNCEARRGPTECNGGECLCKNGYCASSDGVCYPKPYKIDSKPVRIRNVKWPDMYMYVSSYSHIVQVSSDKSTAQSEFFVTHLGSGELMLTSKMFTDSMVIGHWDHTEGDNNNNLRYIVRTQSVARNPPVPKLTLKLKATSDGSSFKISTHREPGRFWYLQHFSWYVHTYWGNPGPQGHWVFEPPLFK